MKKIKRVMTVLMIAILASVTITESAFAIEASKNTSLKKVQNLTYPTGFKYAQGMCVIGGKLYLAYRNDSGKAVIQVWNLKKREKTTEKTLSLGHANSMTYCKRLGGIVVSPVDDTTKLKVIDLKNWKVRTIDIGIKSYAVGYSSKLGLVVGKSKTREFYRFSVDKKGNVKKVKNASFKIAKDSGYEHQGIEVVGSKVFIVQDLVDKKTTTADLNKHYKKNRVLCYNIQYDKNKKKWKKKLFKNVSFPGSEYDCEFEEICYSTSEKKYFIFANKNFGTRKPLLYATKEL